MQVHQVSEVAVAHERMLQNGRKRHRIGGVHGPVRAERNEAARRRAPEWLAGRRRNRNAPPLQQRAHAPRQSGIRRHQRALRSRLLQHAAQQQRRRLGLRRLVGQFDHRQALQRRAHKGRRRRGVYSCQFLQRFTPVRRVVRRRERFVDQPPP